MGWLVWLYIINTSLLLVHEMDSAYQQEWELFKLKGGVTTFLLIHIPVVMAILYGLLELNRATMTGYVFSIIVSIVGVGALVIHSTFWKAGHPEFKSPLSMGILFVTALSSFVQLILTVAKM